LEFLLIFTGYQQNCLAYQGVVSVFDVCVHANYKGENPSRGLEEIVQEVI